MGAMIRTERKLVCQPDCWNRTNVELEGQKDKRAWIVWLLVWSVKLGKGHVRFRLMPTDIYAHVDFETQENVANKLREIRGRLTGIQESRVLGDGEVCISYDILDVLGEDTKDAYLPFFESAIKIGYVICNVLGIDPSWFNSNMRFETHEAVFCNGEWVQADGYLKHKFNL